MDIKCLFRPGAEGVHEMITQGAAAKAGFSAAQISDLVKGNKDIDFPERPSSWTGYLGVPGLISEILSRHYGDNAQVTHALRKEEHTGPDANRQAIEATKNYIKEHTLNAWELYRRGKHSEALFQAGKASHTLQDSYAHMIRNLTGSQQRGSIKHVRSFVGDQKDHDKTIDTGLARKGGSLTTLKDRSIEYNEAWNASAEFFPLLKNILNTSSKSNVERMLDGFMDKRFQPFDPTAQKDQAAMQGTRIGGQAQVTAVKRSRPFENQCHPLQGAPYLEPLGQTPAYSISKKLAAQAQATAVKRSRPFENQCHPLQGAPYL